MVLFVQSVVFGSRLFLYRGRRERKLSLSLPSFYQVRKSNTITEISPNYLHNKSELHARSRRERSFLLFTLMFDLIPHDKSHQHQHIQPSPINQHHKTNKQTQFHKQNYYAIKKRKTQSIDRRILRWAPPTLHVHIRMDGHRCLITIVVRIWNGPTKIRIMWRGILAEKEQVQLLFSTITILPHR